MHIELIDALRCRVPHEDSWLVGRFDRVEERDIIEGVLGCPVCRAEYPIRMGAVYYDAPGERPGDSIHAPAPDPAPATPEAVMRLAAMLGLIGPGGLALLAGSWAAVAPVLEELVDVRLLLLNPVLGGDASRGSAIVCRDRIPVAPGALRAVALDAAAATQPLFASAEIVLRPGGRLVIPAASSATLPAGLVEVARDADHIVAERRQGTPPIPLRRG